jgi:hypothetical protein
VKENNFSPRILYPAKLWFKIKGGLRIFQDKQKLKQYITLSHHYRRFWKESYTQKMKTSIVTKGGNYETSRRVNK